MRRVRFEPDLDAWLEAEAKASGRSVSDIVFEAVQRFRREREGELIRDSAPQFRERRRWGEASGSTLLRVTGAIDLGGSIDSRNTGRAYAKSLNRCRDERRADLGWRD